MAQIVERPPVAELEKRCRAARDVTEARHTQAISPKRTAFAAGLLAQGQTTLEVADVLAFTPRWVDAGAAHAATRTARTPWVTDGGATGVRPAC